MEDETNHDAHCIEWARREFHEGRRPEWIPVELLDALLFSDAGSMKEVAAYIREHGVPSMLNGYVADFLEGKTDRPTRIQLRSAEILHFMHSLRQHHKQELQRKERDPSYPLRFAGIQEIQKFVAKRFYGCSDRWSTVEKLEQRGRE